MMIKKKKDSFNDYSVELSWGQLNAIYRALEQDHADPLSDELFAELGWYLENVPGPGEDEEEYKEAKDAEKEAMAGGMDPNAEGGRDMDLVGQEVGAEGSEAPGTEEPEGAEAPIEGEGQPEPEPAEGARGAGGEADQLLERPPRQQAMAA
jgi:hypothetical protein